MAQSILGSMIDVAMGKHASQAQEELNESRSGLFSFWDGLCANGQAENITHKDLSTPEITLEHGFSAGY
ncbi:MAG: hypothetical protein IJY58_00190 [Alphaproteobacteria bacterium]|nr:hypothetical protein [Alphaproteobacteria bacterium]